MKQEEKTIYFGAHCKPAFWLGERFFKIIVPTHRHGGDALYISPKCPVCEDTRIIKYTGKDGIEREASCPYCSSRSSENTAFHKYEIAEFYVNSLELKLPDSMSAYKDARNLSDLNGYATLRAFTKLGRCSDDIVTCSVPWGRDAKVDVLEPKYEYNIDNYIYTSKALATKALKYIAEEEKKRLAEVNKKYGTNYEYPW